MGRCNPTLGPTFLSAGSSEEVARLDARLADLRQENEQLAADNKACYNVIRAKEKELSRWVVAGVVGAVVGLTGAVVRLACVCVWPGVRRL